MTRDNAVSIIEAQMANSGVGRYANAVMTWSATFGPSYPTWLPANGNDIIDSLQQTADIAAFEYIDVGVYRMEQLLMKSADVYGIPVDKFVFETRFSKQMYDTVPAELIIENGKFSRMNDAYRATIVELQEKLNVKSFQTRIESETRNKVMNAVTLKDSTAQWALEFFTKYDNKLKRVDSLYRNRLNRNIDRFERAFLEYDRSNDINNVVAEMYSEITSYKSGVPEKWAVALYRWIIDPALTRTKYGKSDRIIFQNGAADQPTIMDLLVEGIKNL